jgi:hypothetical protein
MRNVEMGQGRRIASLLGITLVIAFVAVMLGANTFDTHAATSCDKYIPASLEDQNPTSPLANPDSTILNPRYISGFGSDSDFTLFFEDRTSVGRPDIHFAQTTSGPLGFPSSPTVSTADDFHFLIKDWPYFHDSQWYSYRAWGSDGDNSDHNFWVSNDLVNWVKVSKFTIPNAIGFTTARGTVKFGFHDVIQFNGTYYAWAEASTGLIPDGYETMFVRSTDGGDVWEAFDKVGGDLVTDGPLASPAEGVWTTPTGSFFILGSDCGYGKIHIPGDNSGIYLAVNTVAKPSQDPAVLEANFINPANWTWSDGSTGRLTTSHALIEKTGQHNYLEAWFVPSSYEWASWTIMYTASYLGNPGLGYVRSPGGCAPGFSCTFAPLVVRGS